MRFNYRGTGQSASGADPALIRLAKWGIQDIDALIEEALRIAGFGPVYLVGHSIGGQVHPIRGHERVEWEVRLGERPRRSDR